MRSSITQFSMVNLVVCLSAACVEIHPLSPPELTFQAPQTPQVCEAPLIEKNIVGTWRFESTMTTNNVVHTGVVTFTADKKVIDPDFLFEKDISGDIVISNTYEPKAPSRDPKYPGDVFEVRQDAKGIYQIFLLIVVSNECNKIHMRSWQSANNAVGFFLTRQ